MNYLMKHTQVMVSLSLNVVTRRAGRERLVTWNLVRLTAFMFWLWSLMQVAYGLVEHFLSFCERVYVGYLVINILFNSIIFAVGGAN